MMSISLQQHDRLLDVALQLLPLMSLSSSLSFEQRFKIVENQEQLFIAQEVE